MASMLHVFALHLKPHSAERAAAQPCSSAADALLSALATPLHHQAWTQLPSEGRATIHLFAFTG